MRSEYSFNDFGFSRKKVDDFELEFEFNSIDGGGGGVGVSRSSLSKKHPDEFERDLRYGSG